MEQPSMVNLLIRKNLRWTGHLMRISRDRLPKLILYSQRSSCHRNRGRTRLRFKVTIKRNLKLRDLETDLWTSLSQQRDKWIATVKLMEAVCVASRPTAWWIVQNKRHIIKKTQTESRYIISAYNRPPHFSRYISQSYCQRPWQIPTCTHSDETIIQHSYIKIDDVVLAFNQ